MHGSPPPSYTSITQPDVSYPQLDNNTLHFSEHDIKAAGQEKEKTPEKCGGPKEDEKIEAPEKESFKCLATTFLGATSAHGLPKLVSAGSWFRRSVWLIIFLAAFAYFVAQMTVLMQTFLKYPAAVSIRIEHTPQMQFPAVTVCNMNMLRKSLIADDPRYKELATMESTTQTKVNNIIYKLQQQQQSVIDGRKKRSIDETRQKSDLDNSAIKDNTIKRMYHKGKIYRDLYREAWAKGHGVNLSLIVGKSRRPVQDEGNALQHDLRDDNLIAEKTEKSVGKLRREKRQTVDDGGSGDVWGDFGNDDYWLGADPDVGGTADPDVADQAYGEDWWNDEGMNWENGANDPAQEGGDSYDWGQFEFEDYGFSNAEDDYAFDDFVRAAKTPDFSDLLDVLKPTREDLDNYGHQKENMIVQCSFNKKNCSHNDFIKSYNPFFGNCFTFNHGQDNTSVRMTSKYGSRYGLRLTLNIEYQEYLGLFSPKVGARVAIHPANVSPFPEDYGVSAAPGRETEIGVELKVVTREKTPYPSNCTDGTPYALNYHGNYTVTACSSTCLQNKLLEKCGCNDRKVVNASEPRCSLTNRTEEVCRQRVNYLYETDSLGCECPPSCMDQVYKATTSSATWPSDPYSYWLATTLIKQNTAKYLQQDIMETLINGNLVRLQVYISSPNVDTIAEFPAYPWDRLLADFGGLLGLFIGTSALTAAELVEFVVDLTLLAYRRCQNRRKVAPRGKKGQPTTVHVRPAGQNGAAPVQHPLTPSRA